jgi:hypothetical protein
MLLSKDAIADVMESLSLNDFYKPAHSLVFDAIMDLYARGEPADTITVAAELDKNGTLGRIGGAVYLHTLMATVPTAANAAFYAQIVAEKAILRRLVEAGTRIVQLGYGGNEGDAGGGEVDEIVDRAQAEIYDVTERRTTEDYVILEELLQPTMDEIDAIAQQGGRAAGVPTGFADLDNLTNGLVRNAGRNLHRLPLATTRLAASGRLTARLGRTYDAVLMPTLAHETPLIGHLDPMADYDQIMDRLIDWVAFTPLQNATGDPAISLPLAVSAAGMPVGMMFASTRGQEARLLRLAYELEAAKPWAKISA